MFSVVLYDVKGNEIERFVIRGSAESWLQREDGMSEEELAELPLSIGKVFSEKNGVRRYFAVSDTPTGVRVSLGLDVNCDDLPLYTGDPMPKFIILPDQSFRCRVNVLTSIDTID